MDYLLKIVNIMGGRGLYTHLTSSRIFTLISNKIFIGALKFIGKVGMTQFGVGNDLVLVACFTSYKKWV